MWKVTLVTVLFLGSKAESRNHPVRVNGRIGSDVPNFSLDPHPPFYLGVASGDPLPDSVLLWTRATPRGPIEEDFGADVHWRIWSPPISSEEVPTLHGNDVAEPERDFTLKINASPLPFPNQTYYYRFYYGNRTGAPGEIGGERSRLGRTRTAPDPDTEGGLLTFAYTSCTQQYYHLNSLSHLAWNFTLGGEVDESLRPSHSVDEPDENLLYQSEAIHALLHGGDSLYDYDSGIRRKTVSGKTCSEDQEIGEFVDPALDPAFAPLPLLSTYNCSWNKEQVFFSFAFFPLNIDEWRWRHIMVRLDPDRRAAYAAHPHIQIADSHEGGPQGASNSSMTSLQAFDWYTPSRVRFENHPLSGEEQAVLYRDFYFGKLAHLIVIDARGIGRQQPENTFLGNPQRNWLINDVLQSPNNTDGWRIMMTGKPITAWQINGYRRVALGVLLGVIVPIGLGIVCSIAAFRKKQRLSPEERRACSCRNQTPNDGAIVLKEEAFPTSVTPEEIQGLSKKQAACILCCGSWSCIIIGFIFFIGPIIGVSMFLKFAEDQERLIYHPETDTATIFGEVINWVGSPVDRAELFKDMYDVGATEDNLWVVGDNHMHQAANVRIGDFGHRIAPDQSEAVRDSGRNVFTDVEYNAFARNNEGKLGVEWLPSSTSSGGLYDMLIEGFERESTINLLNNFVSNMLLKFNPHWTHFDSASHGIGYFHITEEKTVMQFFRSDIYFPFKETVLYWQGEVERGANEWGEMQSFRKYWKDIGGY